MRRRGQDPEVSLFPFLSVLAAVIGTLTLVISGLSRVSLAEPRLRVDVAPGDDAHKAPVFVEARREGLVLHGVEAGQAPRLVAARELDASDSAWAELVGTLDGDASRYLVALIRPEGVATWESASRSLHDEVDVVLEPVFGPGELHLERWRP